MYELILGDCAEKLSLFKADFFDSLVTDPPAGISFMGKAWDSDKGGRDAWVRWMTEVMRDKSTHTDSGGASRFFYCAKASKSEKGDGNTHPTVKNLKLMTYLITMITPPGGTVLDPFMGSGSTGVAALDSSFKFIGIEENADYLAIAKARMEASCLNESK